MKSRPGLSLRLRLSFFFAAFLVLAGGLAATIRIAEMEGLNLLIEAPPGLFRIQLTLK